ncbi:hemerythrin domain-containing protein [Sphingomonas sp. 1P06PA]|uniref:hemerythrin domain-containing protein n=1 Tax=Sphingomonas sp. 1P06PA TaxID=554121 RepID=UPI0039A52462
MADPAEDISPSPAAKPAKPRKPAAKRTAPSKSATPKPAHAAKANGATKPASPPKRKPPAKPAPSAAKRAGKAVRSAFDSLPEGTGRMVGAAAAGLVAGLAATVGRKMAVQAVSVGLSADWAEALANEHKAALAIIDEIQATDMKQTAKRGTLLVQLKHALGKHAVEEENIVYCALRDQNDAAHADSLNHDHGYVKQYLYDLEKMPHHEPAWMAKLVEFRGALEKHMREEEDEIFPALKARLSDDQNAEISRGIQREGLALA